MMMVIRSPAQHKNMSETDSSIYQRWDLFHCLGICEEFPYSMGRDITPKGDESISQHNVPSRGVCFLMTMISVIL